MAYPPPARHLLRAKELVDTRYAEPLTVGEMARAAGLSRAHFSDRFRHTFGETPQAYLQTRRLERAAALLRSTERPVSDICWSVGLSSVGSFTSAFTRAYGVSPSVYRLAFPPAAQLVPVPPCMERMYGRPRNRTSGEAAAPQPG